MDLIHCLREEEAVQQVLQQYIDSHRRWYLVYDIIGFVNPTKTRSKRKSQLKWEGHGAENYRDRIYIICPQRFTQISPALRTEVEVGAVL